MTGKPRKRFGQHFLHDPGVIRRIIEAISPAPGQAILEIGPGQGAITEGLIAAGSDLTAVEIDRDLATALALRFEDRLRVVCTDILEFKLNTLANCPLSVVGNLPYNISTPVIFHLLAQLDQIGTMVFMLQREVAERLAALPGNKTYGRLTVNVQLNCNIEYLFTVARGAFNPPPKVTSAVVALTPRSGRPSTEACGVLDQLLLQAFARRRKTIRNAFSGLLNADDLAELGLDPRVRPENLTPDDFLRCATRLHQGNLN